MLSKIANYLRAMQLFYHAAHNLSKGSLFFQDHETLGDFYSEIEKDYDAVIERAINKEGDQVADLQAQLKDIFSQIKSKQIVGVKENKDFFVQGLECEKFLCEMIQQACSIPECSEGTKQLIGDISNRSEVRQYKILRRVQ